MNLAIARPSETVDATSAQEKRAAGHIAIIDDDAPVGRALARLIKAHSYPVQVYQSAREFLDALKTGTPACLIVDLQMEEMTGLQLVHHLADMGLRIPTVFVTARDEPGMQHSCEASGAIAFLLKPVMSEPLLAAINAALSSSGQGRGQTCPAT
jgi:FixJ family two-component response regulator